MTRESRKNQWIVPVAVTVVLVTAAFVFRSTLLPWFGLGGDGHEGHSHGRAPASPEALAALNEALEAYEGARTLLADDQLEGVSEHASELVRAFEAAVANGAPDTAGQGARAAGRMGKAKTIEEARAAFEDVSLALVSLASDNPSLTQNRFIFQCPMTDGFGKWIQTTEKLENPYMGHSMLACGTASEWEAPEDAIAYHTCPMHPSIKQEGPGTCPICGMDLTPVLESELRTGVLFVDAKRRQQIGVRTETIGPKRVDVRVEAVGKVAYDASSRVDVTLKYKAWVRKLHANKPAQRVKKGEPLVSVYSPELYGAQQDYLNALASQKAAASTGAPNRSDYLVKAARGRLKLWDVPDWQVERIAAGGEPVEAFTIASPADGFALETNVVEGGVVEAGQTLFRIARLNEVWVEADIHERDLAFVALGMKANVTLPHAGDRVVEGTVDFIHPLLDEETRTARARVVVANDDLTLKPGMFASVEFVAPGAERLVVPESAVLYVGKRRLTFLDLGEGRLRPQEIKLGAKSGEGYEVVEGLSEGDVVVTSANFLIAAESRLKSAVEQWQ